MTAILRRFAPDHLLFETVVFLLMVSRFAIAVLSSRLLCDFKVYYCDAPLMSNKPYENTG